MSGKSLNEPELTSQAANDYGASEAIYAAAKNCLTQFQHNLNAQHGDRVTEELRGRFNLWAAYIGAFAAPRASLDARLANHPEIRDMVVELLHMIQENLEWASVPRKAQDFSDTSPGLPTVDSGINRLLSLSVSIRRPRHQSRLSKHGASDSIDDEPQHLVDLVRRRYPHARKSLCSQIANSIHMRGKALQYMQEHNTKLAWRRDMENVPEMSTTESEKGSEGSTLFNQYTPPKKLEVPQLSDTLPSEMTPSAVLRLKQKPKVSLSSVSSRGSTVPGGREVYSYPKPPKLGSNKTWQPCSICSAPLKVSEMSQSSWISHVDHDLEPFVCISEECLTPPLFFISKNEWVNHMQTRHSWNWTQSIHTEKWYCNYCTQQSDSEATYMEFEEKTIYFDHLKKSHGDLMTLSQLQGRLRRNRRIGTRDSFVCPLCDCIPPNVEVCIKDKPYQLLWEHIAKHLKSLAFLSLSYLDDDQDRNSTLYASEEASNQGDPSISRESVGVCNIDMFDDIPSTEVFLDHVTVTEQEFPDIPLLAEPEHWKFMPSQNALVDKDPLLAEPEHWKVIPSQNALVDKDDLESRSSNRGQTLDGVMSRIHNQPADLRGVALQALSWVSHVKQPLSPTELRYAVQFDGNFHDIDTIISSCMGLIFEKSNAIHMTYENKEILTNRPLFQGADDKILGVSLHCLMSTEFLTGPCRSNEAFAERLQLHPFYKYASQNWFRYCEEITPQVRYFLANDMLIEASVQALFAGMEDSQRYPRRLTRLHLTAIFGLDRLLIEDRGVIELKDSWGRTPASWAAENGNLAIIQHLIESGAKVDTKEETFGQTPLSIAAQNGHTAAVQWLIGKEADIESLNNSGQTPLSVAAQHGHDAVVRLLLSAGADIESKSDSGRTPLSYATENGNLSVVDLLLHDGADIESNSTSSQTPLAWAAENGNVEVARLLLDRGANIESRSGYGRTPLSWAAQTGHEAVVKLLLDRGAQIEAVSSYGQTALSLAVENGKVSVVKLLLERGADVNSRSGSGRTPLSWSTETGDAVVTKLLIDKGAELDAKDISGSTPLAWAVENGNLAAVRLLLEKGAYLDPVDDNERTPLSIAVENGHNAISLLLLEKGNFLHAVDNNSPIHTSTAITDASNILIRRIQEKGAKADMRDHDRLKALQAILRKYNDTAATLAKTSQAKRGDVSKSTDGEAEGKVTTQDAPAADKSLVSIFKSDTIIDGTVMAPDMDFEQTWVLRNDGDIPWPSGCMLIFISGNSMGRPELQETSSTGDLKPYNMSAATSNLVEPGQEASFTVYLRSPPREGRFISYWRLVTKSGVRFGHRLWCDIVVKKEEED